MSCVRHFGPEKAREVARRTVEGPHPYVTGFGMGGDEAGFPPEDFAAAFAIAREAGLGLTVHAGEWAGPESVRGGARAAGSAGSATACAPVEDPELVRELADKGRCSRYARPPTSCSGLYPSYEAHPLPALRAAGVAVTLGSDDPPYWDASIGGRVRGGRRAHGLRRARRCARSPGPRSMRLSSRTKSARRSWISFRLRRTLFRSLRRVRS